MDTTHILQSTSMVVGAVAAILVGLGVIIRYVRKMYHWTHWFSERVLAVFDLVEKELTPNGGESIHDRVGKILVKVLEHDKALHRGAERFDRIEERLDNMGGTVSYEPFPCKPND